MKLLDPAKLLNHLPTFDESSVRAAYFPLDLRVDPRQAIPAVAGWLESRGARFHWGTTIGALGDGEVVTSRGTMTAEHVIVCVGHDPDRLLPEVADRYDVTRCYLQMFEVSPPSGCAMFPALLSGSSMLHYPAMRSCRSAERVRERLQASSPELLAHGVNLMVTRRPDGHLMVGDSHHYDRTPPPADDERVAALVLQAAAKLLGVDQLDVRRRWRGVYASSAQTGVLIHDQAPRTTVVSVTSGIGMTVAPGLAERVIDRVCDGAAPLPRAL